MESQINLKEERHWQFRELLDSIPLSQGGIAQWMYHRNTKKTRDYVSRKYTGKVTVTESDITLLYLLKQLELTGVNLDQAFLAMGVAGLVIPQPPAAQN